MGKEDRNWNLDRMNKMYRIGKRLRGSLGFVPVRIPSCSSCPSCLKSLFHPVPVVNRVVPVGGGCISCSCA